MPLLSSAVLWFDEVARQGSIRRAAGRLNASPSAVNRQILLLEAEMGAPLFERLPRGMRLTAAGEVLINDVRRWRREQDRTKAQLEELQGLRRGHVAVGLMECLAGDFMPGVFAALHGEHRRLTFSAMVGGSDDIADALEAAELDLAIGFDMPPRPNIRLLQAVEVPMGLIVPPDHPLAGRSAVRLSDGLGDRMILPDRSLSLRSRLDLALARADHRPAAPLVSNSIAFIKAAVQAGEGVTVLTSVDVYAERRDGRLAFVPLAEPGLTSERLSLSVRQGASLPPATAVVAEAITRALAGLCDGAAG